MRNGIEMYHFVKSYACTCSLDIEKNPCCIDKMNITSQVGKFVSMAIFLYLVNVFVIQRNIYVKCTYEEIFICNYINSTKLRVTEPIIILNIQR